MVDIFDDESRHRDSPLHSAVSSENFDLGVIRGLLEQGQNPNAWNKCGYAPLHYVVQHSKAEPAAVRLFVEDYGADVDVKSSWMSMDNTPLIELLGSPRCTSKMAMELIQCGADVNASDSYDCKRPLSLAISNKNCDLVVVLELMLRGARVHHALGLSAEDGHTPLHLASVLQRPDMVRYLLQNKWAVDARDSTGRTPLLMMLEKCTTLEKEKDVQTKVILVLEKCMHLDNAKDIVEIILELVDCGANVNVSDADDDVTPLIAYLKSEHDSQDALYVVQTLLDLGGDVNARNKSTENPLDICLLQKNLNLLVIRELVERGAHTKKLCYREDTPLQVAISRYDYYRDSSSEECVKLLIKYSLLNSKNHLECIASEGGEEFMPREKFRAYTAACRAELVMSQSVMISDNTSLYMILTEDRIQKENKRCIAIQEQRQRVADVNRRAYHKDGTYTLLQPRWFSFGLASSYCVDKDCLDVATDNLLSVLAQKTFPIFEDIIYSLFTSDRNLLLERLNRMTIYVPLLNDDSVIVKRIVLNCDCVGKLCEYLSETDVLSLILASFDTCVSV